MDIKKLEKGDVLAFTQLIKIFKEVFENDEAIAPAEQSEKLLSDSNFLVFVVSQNEEVIGGLTIYILHRYHHAKPIAYIYDVGIDPNFQGKGYGKALIASVCDYCRKNSFDSAYVEAESDDLDAVEFHRRTKCSSEMNATHFTYSFSNNH